MTPTLQAFLLVSAALFSIGLLAALSRRHAIFILIGIEMMLAAANLNFIAFWRFAPPPHPSTGVMIAIFSIAISAAEAAVGLAMVIVVYRHFRTTNVDQYDQLKEWARQMKQTSNVQPASAVLDGLRRGERSTFNAQL